MQPTHSLTDYPTVTFCNDSIVTFTQGFIQTPDYPSMFSYDKHCKMKIILPVDATIRFYIVQLSLRTLTERDDSCYDSITYSDGQQASVLCGDIDRPQFEYRTQSRELEFELQTFDKLPTDNESPLRGSLLFFFIDNNITMTTASSESTYRTNTLELTTSTTTKSTYDSTTSATRITSDSTSTRKLSTSTGTIWTSTNRSLLSVSSTGYTKTEQQTPKPSTPVNKPKSNHKSTIIISTVVSFSVVLLGLIAFIFYRRMIANTTKDQNNVGRSLISPLYELNRL
ncbi:unnamed protein product [Didymodactylos carnosus]|uniref:CUB domain-containing protein n=1 Tax=Didymodactylos carnosus TaxID=1234261 RepID=A0A8S2FW51_9BILA|nr:unnamed protein product [Didymodactylos carnosus]CAF4363093.1 unnamed protein product [Didymodactylos carnosus]